MTAEGPVGDVHPGTVLLAKLVKIARIVHACGLLGHAAVDIVDRLAVVIEGIARKGVEFGITDFTYCDCVFCRHTAY